MLELSKNLKLHLIKVSVCACACACVCVRVCAMARRIVHYMFMLLIQLVMLTS